jgi:hypothetical protein
MRKRFFCSVAAALVGAGAATAQAPAYLPGAAAPPAPPLLYGQIVGTPVLLPLNPQESPVVSAAPCLGGGSTGLRPGVDCLPDPAACRRRPRLYGELAYLLAWVKDGPTPGPLAVLYPPAGGVGGPGTFVITGGRDFDFNALNGATATVGYWLDTRATYGVEASGFVLETQVLRSGAAHDGAATNPVALARPYYPTTGGVTGLPVGLPGVLAGSVLTTAATQFWGADLNGVVNLRESDAARIDLLGGFAYYDLRESLGIDQQSALVGPTATAGCR